MKREADGTLRATDGRLVSEPTRVWAERIRRGGNCFVCGALEGTRVFNNEHVLPEWILRKYNLFKETITLPNGTTHRYDTYTIPCCASCNALLGQEIEKPVSQLIHQGYTAVIQYIEANGPFLFAVWMALVYFKTHYKDLTLRANRDRRIGEGFLGDRHRWERLQHAYALAVSPYTRAKIRRETIGSFLTHPTWYFEGNSPFDYLDASPASTVMVRFGEFSFFHNLSDAGALDGFIREHAQRITGPISEIQARELAVRIGYGERLLINPPTHYIELDPADPETVLISSWVDPRPYFREFNRQEFGQILEPNLAPFLDRAVYKETRNHELTKWVREGKISFIYDDYGDFIEQP